MDRNSAIGLTLIAVLLLVYFNYFAPEPPKENPSSITTFEKSDSVSQAIVAARDSVPATQDGPLESLTKGDEKLTKIETADLILSFSNRGGVIKEVELKKFKTYYKKPLLLVASGSNDFKLTATYEGKDLDLYSLFYTIDSKQSQTFSQETKQNEDSTTVTFTTFLAEGKSIKQIYSIPANGYQVNYNIQTSGIGDSFNGDHLTLYWKDNIPAVEKDLAASRTKTTVNYFTTKGDFEDLSESSTDLELEAIASPVKWVGIKQKFFTSAIIARNSFSGGEVSTSANLADTTIVKSALVKLFIPKSDVLANKANFQFFFWPK